METTNNNNHSSSSFGTRLNISEISAQLEAKRTSQFVTRPIKHYVPVNPVAQLMKTVARTGQTQDTQVSTKGILDKQKEELWESVVAKQKKKLQAYKKISLTEKSKSFSTNVHNKKLIAFSISFPARNPTRPRIYRSNSEPFMHSWDYSLFYWKMLAEHQKQNQPNAEPEKREERVGSNASDMSTDTNDSGSRKSTMTEDEDEVMKLKKQLGGEDLNWDDFLNDPEELIVETPESTSLMEPATNTSNSTKPPSPTSPPKLQETKSGGTLKRKQVKLEKDRNGKTMVVSASVDYLIQSLISDSSIFDQDYIDRVILAHPLFIDSNEFLNKLVKLFDDVALGNIPANQAMIRRARIINVLKRWISFNDIQDNERIVRGIFEFTEKLIASGNNIQVSWANHLRKLLGIRPSESPAPVKKLPKLKRTGTKSQFSLHYKKIKTVEDIEFIDIEPSEFSKHITVGDWKVFSKIKSSELMHKAWSQQDKEKSAPNLIKLIERFNRLANWVASEIMLTPNPKQRVIVIERFITVMKDLIELRNYHSLWAIYSGLNKGCILGLKNEWKNVGKKYMATMQKVELMLDPRNNFKNYREYIRDCQLPFLPFEGIFLTDLTFLDENPDQLDGLMNFTKIDILGDILQIMKRVQSEAYPFGESTFLKEFIHKAIVLDDEQLVQVSHSVFALTDKRRSLPRQSASRDRRSGSG
mmetsp:Transcript_20105/g.28152  ORF Transcript_20105/g.28152 Transcript_20105/m.28152 type:complete len:698 (+) Transcript_20105:164-2257(+)